MPTTIKHKTSPLSHAFYVWVNKTWGVGEHGGKRGFSELPVMMVFVWRLLGRWFWNRVSAGRWDTSLVMLPSSEQGPRHVLMDCLHLKIPLLQNQPMIIIKTFPLQMLLALICLSFGVSKMCLCSETTYY